jgi:membrane fusion protein (multidrug efflux system)
MEAEAQITVKAESPGRVVSIPAREGTRVDVGQLLLVLDTTKLSAELEVAEAAVARAETESRNLRRRLDRNRQLLEEGAISPQTFDDIEAQTETAEAVLRESRARLELARERLDDATVEAPFAGQVGERTVDVGDYLAVGDPLFVLVDDDPLEIDFPVPERYVGRIREGAPVDFRVRSLPGRTFVGQVVFVSPVVDTETRTVTVKARVPNTESELRAGQFGEVRLELGLRPEAVVVPEAAIVPGRTEDAVYLVEGDTARRRVVTLGTRTVGRIEVVSGVEAGDTVVVAGQQRLSDGVPVRISEFSVSGDGGFDTTAVGDTAAGEAPASEGGNGGGG